jgi:FlaA1/EpsC-like NDP-sugar epimerase
MSEMITFNHRSAMSYILASVDGILVFASVLLAVSIYPMGRYGPFMADPYPVAKVMLVVIVTEITLYYFGLMELKLLRQRIRMTAQLVKALGVYALALVVIYFMLPHLAMSHRTLFVCLALIFWLTFFWRLLFQWIANNALFKERVLIVGTGELAKQIYKEIGENGLDAYEVVGFVDESGKRVGEKISPDDHRGFQANLFHLQNLSN